MVAWFVDVVFASVDVAVVRAVAVDISPSPKVATSSTKYVFPA
ncbi:MAG TPA: hypothetical protein VMU77_04190 [Acidimicrobiales bacterium]|nr:hypothetical protein [Acidimicrobiales bacterium]